MVQSNSHPRDNGNSSLAALSRTLEALEARLSALGTPPGPPLQPAAAPGPASQTLARETGAPAARRKPSPADAVSEIAMRRRMLDDAPHAPDAVASAPPRRPMPAPDHLGGDQGPRQSDAGLDRRFQALASDIEALRAEGSSYALMAEVAEELQRLRHDLKQEGPLRGDPRFEDIRQSFDGLRAMIETRQSPEAISAELTAMSASLARLTEDGADRATLNALRAELEETRGLFGEMAKEKSVTAVGQRWDDFETRYATQTEREVEARRDLKTELERLRESLRSLPSEEHIRAVEKRWDDFETHYMGTPPAPSGDEISRLLRDELEGMRAKLEGMAEKGPPGAVEARWGAIEKRLDSREIETSIEMLAARLGEIETALARLPESLGIAPLEERIRALASGVEALARREQDTELGHFVALEERLDEISRAIVATSVQPAPTIDMAPIERIEARIATLTSRVDRISDAGDAELLSRRIAELSDRVEALAGSSATTETIAARMSGFAERFDAAFAQMELPRLDTAAITARMGSLAERFDAAFAEFERQPRLDTAAIEERLSALSARLDEADRPRVDQDMMRSLEAQIARLSEHLAQVGTLSAGDFDQDIGRRLALVEQRLDENRDALIAAARQAADDTARRMQEAGDRRQGEHVAQLSEHLRSLESLARDTDDRSNKVFDAVHSTLLKIVDRLDLIEAEIAKGEETERPPAFGARAERTAAHTAAVAGAPAAAERLEAPAPSRLRNAIARVRPGKAGAEASEAALAPQSLLERPDPSFDDRALDRVAAPSLDASGIIDPSEANRPLEPGSGAPDIGALLERVRLQQRNKSAGAASEPAAEAETRAAARRAVKAAVAEAEMLRSPSAAGAATEGRFNLANLVARRRKTILVGVTAVLVALAALPVGKALLSRVDGAGSGRAPLQGSADPVGAVPARGGDKGAGAASVPAAPKATSTTPAAPADAPQRSSSAASASPTAMSALASAGTVPPATPGAAKPAAAMMTAPATTAAPQAFAAEPGAPTEITAQIDTPTFLASAEAKLPASATGAMPAVADTIGTPALVAAAKAGEPKAHFEIGLRLLEGRGGEPKPAEALAWFAQAAKRGFAPAQYSLGTLFEKGNGVARDTGAARDWYLLAAKQGNVRAMHNLAVLYATGIEGKSEPETAAIWFEQAAGFGMRDSQYNLGILYARGSGVEQSLPASYKWFAIVAKAGDKDAGEKKDEIAKSLSPEEVRAAEAAVAGWTPKARAEEANTVEVPQTWSDARLDRTASVDMTRAVRNIQAILGKLGYDAGTPDGVVGSRTTTAIAAFQKEAGLAPTGKIDETLIRALLQRKDG